MHCTWDQESQRWDGCDSRGRCKCPVVAPINHEAAQALARAVEHRLKMIDRRTLAADPALAETREKNEAWADYHDACARAAEWLAEALERRSQRLLRDAESALHAYHGVGGSHV